MIVMLVVSLSFFQSDQNYRNTQKSTSPPFTAISTLKRAFYKIKNGNELKMPSIRYTDHQKTQCVIWMADGHRGTTIQRTILQIIV